MKKYMLSQGNDRLNKKINLTTYDNYFDNDRFYFEQYTGYRTKQKNKIKEEKMMEKMIEKRDVLFARVSANLKGKGCFLETAEGVTVFMPNFNFQSGTKVICSVFKVTEDKYPLVNLDSVIYDDLVA